MRCILLFVILIAGCATSPKPSRTNWLSSFDNWEQDSSGKSYSIQKTASIKRHSAESLRFEVRPGDTYDNKGKKSYRAEVEIDKNISIRSEQWYGFSLFLPQDFPKENNRLVLAQWWAPTKKYLGEVSRSPSMALRYREGRLHVTIRYSNERVIKDADTVPSKEIFSTEQFQLGQWSDFVFHVKWSSQSDGFAEVWWNGKQVANYRGPIGYNDDQGPVSRFGIYRDDTDKAYVSYISEYRIGNSYQEVNPSQSD